MPFLLQPCHIRGHRVVLSDEPPLKLSPQELLEKFAPARLRPDLVKLRSMRLGGYVGRARARSSRGEHKHRKVLFTLFREDRGNDLGFVLKDHPDFAERLLEVYRVGEIDWGNKVEELLSGKKDPPPPLQPLPRRAPLQEARA